MQDKIQQYEAMKCKYKEKLIFAGDMIFGVVYPTFSNGKKYGKNRRRKFRETSEIQKKNNDRRAANVLTWYIHENFGKEDYVISPTFKNSTRPQTEEEFKREIRNYIDRVKRLYKKAGVEFRAIIITEYGESGKPHLHIFMPGGVSRDDIEKAWGEDRGRCNSKRLQFDECGIVDLSEYLSKETRKRYKRRFTTTRNIRKPQERTNVNYYSRKQCVDIMESANPHEFFAKKYPGYWLSESPHVEKNNINGGYYMTFVMYNPQGKNLMKRKQRKDNKNKRSKGEL